MSAPIRERIAGAPELYVEAQGTGPLLLLAHGFGGSARNWRPQARALADHVRTVVFDVRGHARSDAPEEAEAYRPEAFVADFARVLDWSGATRAVVGGLSMGAGLALRFALAHPERVRALVLAAFPPPPASGRGGTWAHEFADAIDADGLEEADAVYAWGQKSGFDPKAAALIKAGFVEHPSHAIAHTLRELLALQPAVVELAPQLAALAIPALIVVGAHDPLSLEPCRALARALPDAELCVVEGAGHVVNLEARDAVNEAMAAFLGRLAVTESGQ